MEDVRKHLGIDPTAKDSEVLRLILGVAQEALENEIYSKELWVDEGYDVEDFEMDFGGLDEEQDYGLLQALRRIFQ